MEINSFDALIMSALNTLARRSSTFDQFVILINGSELLKVGAVVAVYVSLFFCRPKHEQHKEFSQIINDSL